MKGISRFISVFVLIQLLLVMVVAAIPAQAPETPETPEINPDWFTVEWEVQREDSLATLWNCDLSANGSLVACVYFDMHVNIYNASNGRLVKELDVPPPSGSRCDGLLTPGTQYPLRYCSFSPNNEYLAICGDDKAARVYSTETWEIVREFPDHEAACLSVSWSPNSTWLVTGTGKEKVNGTGDEINIARLWNFETGDLVRKFDNPILGQIMSSRFSPSGGRLAINSDNSIIYIYNCSDLALNMTLEGHGSGVLDCDWSNDEEWIVSGSRDYTARVWDLKNKTNTMYVHENCVRGARWDRSNKFFLTSGIEKTARLYDPRVVEPVVTFTEGEEHESNVMASRWSLDGQAFFSALGKSRILVKYVQVEPPPPPWYDPLLNKTLWGVVILIVASTIGIFLIMIPLKDRIRGRRG